jgi:hypothetical protein
VAKVMLKKRLVWQKFAAFAALSLSIVADVVTI